MQENTQELKISDLHTYWVEDHNQRIDLLALRAQTPQLLAEALAKVEIIESQPSRCAASDAISNLAFYWQDEQEDVQKKVLIGSDSCISKNVSELERQHYIGYVSLEDYQFIADLLKIEDLGGYFFKNDFYAFYYYTPLEGVDVGTFRPISGSYAEDDYYVYFAEWIKPVTKMSVDTSTFEVLGNGYSKDASQVFFEGQTIDAKTDNFKVLVFPYATDGEKVFYHDRQLANADPQSFQSLGEYYSKDSSQVWFGESVLEGADVASFQITRICGYNLENVRENLRNSKRSEDESSTNLNLHAYSSEICLAVDAAGVYYFSGAILNLED